MKLYHSKNYNFYEYLKRSGIEENSNSYYEYEKAKKLLPENLTPCQYEQAIRCIIKYIRL